MPKKFTPATGSMGRMFERRGDPMVTRREGENNFGRVLDTENTERDWWYLYSGEGQHTRARFAEEKKQHVDPPGQKIIADDKRKIALILYQMNRKLKKGKATIAAESKLRPFRLCAGCHQETKCIKHGLCHK